MPTTRAGKVSVPRILVETVMDNNKTVMEEDAIDLFPSLSGGAKFQESPTEFVLRLGSELQVNELAARLKEYSNGLDKYEARTRFQRIIVTKKKQRQFEVQSDWEPSADLIALPFCWQKKPDKESRHHFSQILRVCSMIADELGYPDVLSYLETRGWQIHKRKGKFHLQYIKIDEDFNMTNDQAVRHQTRNLKAMITLLYRRFENTVWEEVDFLTKSVRLKFIQLDSFVAKLDGFIQDLHIAYVITLRYFKPYCRTVKSNQDTLNLMCRIFGACHTRARFTLQCNNIFSLIPFEGDGSFQVDLLNHHMEDLYDYLAMKSRGAKYDEEYSKFLMSSLNTTFQQSSKNPNKRGEGRDDLIVRARTWDLTYDFRSPESKKNFRSATRKKATRKSSSNKKSTDSEASSSKSSRLSSKPHASRKKSNSVCSPSLKRQCPTSFNETSAVDVGHLNTDELSDNSPSKKKAPTVNDYISHRNQSSSGKSLVYRLSQLPSMVEAPGKSATTIDKGSTSTASTSSEQRIPLDLDGDLTARFRTWEFASQEEINNLSSRFVVWIPDQLQQDEEHVVWSSPAYHYICKDLKTRDHAYFVGTPDTTPRRSTLNRINVVPSGERYNDDLTVLRHGGRSGAFSEFFDSLDVDLGLLVEFVLCRGTKQVKRDGVNQTYNCRLDIGCAGQDKEQLKNGTYIPAKTFGTKAFEDIESGKYENIKSDLAALLDAHQRCMDFAELGLLKKPTRGFNCELRYLLYGKHLATFLGCKYFRGEHVTLQIKCLNGEGILAIVVIHRDEGNCQWIGYDKVGGLCFVIKDALGNFWSFKIIVCGKGIIGNYFDEKFQLKQMQTRIKSQCEYIDQEYSRFFREYNGDYPLANCVDMLPPNHHHFQNMVLDDHCCWTSFDITGGKHDTEPLYIERIKLPAGLVRDYFFSAPASILYDQRDSMALEKLLELAIMCGYQSGFHRFYYIGRLLEKQLAASENPSILYYEKAMELFGTVTSDVDTSGRISASGINFKHVFLDSNGGPNGKMQEMVRTLRELLEWIDSTVGTDNFSQGSVQERFRKTVKEWKSLGDFGNEPTDAPSGDNGKAWDSKQKPRVSNKPNMGEFRLMMIVEICILSGIIVRPHPDLHNLAYPVAGLAAKKQLFHVSEDEHHIVAQKVLVDMNMQKRGMNCFETTMCETWTDRVCKMYDHFFKRQHLFSKTEDGVPIIKRYGTYVWEPAGPARSKPTTDMNHSLL